MRNSPLIGKLTLILVMALAGCPNIDSESSATDDVDAGSKTSTDKQKPEIAIAAPNPYNVTSSSVTFTGVASDNVKVESVECRNLTGNGQAATVTGENSWGASATVATGTTLFGCAATDTADNVGDMKFLTVIFGQSIDGDKESPKVEITTQNPTTTNAQALVLTGTASDNVGVSSVIVTNITDAQQAPLLANFSGGSSTSPTWSVVLSQLASGVNVFSVVSKDTSGNASPAVTITVIYNPVIVDTQRPTIQVATPSPAVSTSSSFTFIGTALDNVGILSVSCSSLTPNVSSPQVNGTGSWFATATLVSGTTAVFACTSKDAMGNTSDPAIMTVTYNAPVTGDTELPKATITAPSSTTSTTSSLTLTGTATDNVGVSQVLVTNLVSASPQPIVAFTTGQGQSLVWSANVALQSGNNTLMVVSKDAVGNVSLPQYITINYSITIGDTQAPSIFLSGPSVITTTNGSILFGGVAADDVGVTSVTCNNLTGNGLAASVSGFNQWTASATLTVGQIVSFGCSAKDAAGNASGLVTVTASYNVTPTTDTIKPNLAITTPNNSTSTTSLFTLAGTASDNVSVGQVIVTNPATGQVVLGSLTGTNWTAIVALAPGSNSLSVVSKDTSENLSLVANVTIVNTVATGDTQKPTISLAVSATATVTSSAFTFTGGASDNTAVASVNCTNLTSNASTISVAGTNSWVATATLASGATTVFACTAKDAANNISDPTTMSVTFNQASTGDTTLPTAAFTTQNLTSSATSSITLAGTAGDNVGVSQVLVTNLANNQTFVAATSSGSVTSQAWTVLVSLVSAGNNTFSVIAKDTTGNASVPQFVTVVFNGTGGGVIVPPPPTGNFTLSCGALNVYVLNPSMPLIDNSGARFNESQPGQSLVIPAATFCGGPMFDSAKNEVFEAICVNRQTNTWTSQGLTVTRADGTLAPLRTGLNNGNNLMATPTDLGCAGTSGNGGGATGAVAIPPNAVLNTTGGIVVTPPATQTALQLFAGALTDGTISAVSFSPQMVSNVKLEVANDLNFTAITKTISGVNGTTSPFVVPALKVTAPTTVHLRATGTDAANRQIQSAVVSAVYYPFAIGFNPVPGSTSILATGKIEIVAKQVNTPVAVKTVKTGSDIEPVWVLNQISLPFTEVCPTSGAQFVNMYPVPTRMMISAQGGNVLVYKANGQLFNASDLPVVGDPNYSRMGGWTWLQVGNEICQ